MTLQKQIIGGSLGLLALYLPGILCSIYSISDDRVRGMDITPVLGRGYSIMTNMFYSTCLLVEETTVPSFNYDCKVASSFGSSKSRGFWAKKGSSNSNSFSESSSYSKNFRMMTSTMKIERYYSSVREEVSPLSSDAATLLGNEDYIGFFKACGPNYLRGIRRAQELFASFIFQSSSREKAVSFMSEIKTRRFAVRSGRSSSSKQEQSSLEIIIEGFGLGLDQKGSEALIASNVEEYERVIKFAYNTMTKVAGSEHVGMVYGVDIVPWVHNTEFQVAAGVTDTVIEIPLPRSLIPIADPSDGSCKNNGFVKDSLNYCCEQENLYKDGVYVGASFSGLINGEVCRPLRTLDPTVIKDNMINNGEFVSRLDSTLRYKLATVATLEKCISAANVISNNFLYNKLEAKDSARYDRQIDMSVTLSDLKLALDPLGDYGLVKQYTSELQEWIDMFYEPCYAALFGKNIEDVPDIDVTFFMAYPWYSHNECMKLTCLTPSLRWDRESGETCVSGVLFGNEANPYTNDESYCSKENDIFEGATETCKFPQDLMSKYQTSQVKGTCWGALPVSNFERLLTHFCLPEVTYDQVTGNDLDVRKNAYNSCRG